MKEKSSIAEKSEAIILAEVFEDVRGLTKFYLHRAKEVDPFRVYEAYGTKLNSLYWIMGHIVWAEYYLLVEALTGNNMEIPWLKNFERGSNLEENNDNPSVEDIKQAMDLVHNQAMEGLRAMSNAELGEPNSLGIEFSGGNSKRVLVRHAIRHEPCHSGQIGWILRMNGLESF
jgi:uncharacterized damage-inducible protein DinB